MKCDICNQEFANSEEVKLHKERDHPLDEQKPGDEELEKPDNLESEPERPEPIVRPAH